MKRPPLIRKKTQAFTANEKPKHSAMYNSCEGLDIAPTTLGLLGAASRATCVPEKAKKRNKVVPTYSALVATKWFLAYKSQIQSDMAEKITHIVGNPSQKWYSV